MIYYQFASCSTILGRSIIFWVFFLGIFDSIGWYFFICPARNERAVIYFDLSICCRCVFLSTSRLRPVTLLVSFHSGVGRYIIRASIHSIHKYGQSQYGCKYPFEFKGDVLRSSKKCFQIKNDFIWLQDAPSFRSFPSVVGGGQFIVRISVFCELSNTYNKFLIKNDNTTAHNMAKTRPG